jgi:hypothetical protein
MSTSLNLDDSATSFPVPHPVHPAGPAENAKNAFPTGPWTARTPRRPQAAQVLLQVSLQEESVENKVQKAANSLATKTGHFHLLSTVNSADSEFGGQ